MCPILSTTDKRWLSGKKNCIFRRKFEKRIIIHMKTYKGVGSRRKNGGGGEGGREREREREGGGREEREKVKRGRRSKHTVY